MASVQVTVPPTSPSPAKLLFHRSAKAEEEAEKEVQVAEEAEQAASKAYVYTAFINSNRDTIVQHDTPTQWAPCLE